MAEIQTQRGSSSYPEQKDKQGFKVFSCVFPNKKLLKNAKSLESSDRF